MIKDITLGQFFPGNSVIHRLDPRIKLVLVVFYIALLFMATSFFSYIVLLISTLTVMILTKIPMKLYVRSLKPLLFIIIFTSVLNIFYTVGDPIFSFWVFTITTQGIYNAVFMVFRIMMMVTISSVLTYTTSPIVLTGALERLLSPLAKIRLPIHEFTMMMTIALRFIPTLLEETDKIMSAQKARGADFETGSIIKRAKALIPILIPLFVSAFRHAIELATAMECRCYNPENKKRTHLTQYKLHFYDIHAVISVVIISVLVIFLNRFIFLGSI